MGRHTPAGDRCRNSDPVPGTVLKFRAAAAVRGVVEVTLRARADLGFWKRELSPQGLAPVERGGAASLLIGANAARFAGFRFQELALAVEVEPDLNSGLAREAFLWQGFTSRRFFAWVERNRFRTPYRHAAIRVSGGPSAGFEVGIAGRPQLRAAMAAAAGADGDPARAPLRIGDEPWSGRIHLPAGADGPRRCFFARLEGAARVFTFDAARDAFELAPPPRPAAFELLDASGAVGKEWLVRAAGVHARSRTVLRGDPPPR